MFKQTSAELPISEVPVVKVHACEESRFIAIEISIHTNKNAQLQTSQTLLARENQMINYIGYTYMWGQLYGDSQTNQTTQFKRCENGDNKFVNFEPKVEPIFFHESDLPHRKSLKCDAL
jgi:hypothetical protein